VIQKPTSFRTLKRLGARVEGLSFGVQRDGEAGGVKRKIERGGGGEEGAAAVREGGGQREGGEGEGGGLTLATW